MLDEDSHRQFTCILGVMEAERGTRLVAFQTAFKFVRCNLFPFEASTPSSVRVWGRFHSRYDFVGLI